MNGSTRIVAAAVAAAAVAACGLPLTASAQTPPKVVPPDQPSSTLQQKQTTDTGQATQYGGPGTNTTPATDKTKAPRKAAKAGTSKTDDKPGDVPAYPSSPTDGKPK